MYVRSRAAAALAVAGLIAPALSACDFQKSSTPTAPLTVTVHTVPVSTNGPVQGTPRDSDARAPDPPEGHRLGLPDMAGVVHKVADEHPQALWDSCHTWQFMDLLVDELRRHDTRWGYNWKRGNVGDPSHDVVAYHWGPGEDEGSTNVYLIDVIVGHCGHNPSPGWLDVTDATYGGGSIGRWTGRGRF